MTTLLLDRTAWDLVLDASGNIALADEPYAVAQDVACAVRTFIGECWYDTSQGLPYFSKIVGQWPPIPLIKSLLVRAALTVPTVVSARCVGITLSGRTLTGQIQIIDTKGQSNNVHF